MFGKRTDFPTSPKLGDRKQKESNETASVPATISNDVVKEGWLDVLVSSTDGKVIRNSSSGACAKSIIFLLSFSSFKTQFLSHLFPPQKTDANHWKSIYTVIKSDAIFFHRDKGTSAGHEQVDVFAYLCICH